MKPALTVFVSIVLAELGDKTQLATLLFATDRSLNRAAVFIAASAALVLTSLLAVVFGAQISRFIPPAAIKTIAGVGFIIIGIWVLVGDRL